MVRASRPRSRTLERVRVNRREIMQFGDCACSAEALAKSTSLRRACQVYLPSLCPRGVGICELARRRWGSGSSSLPAPI